LFFRMRESLGTPDASYHRGVIYQLPEAQGREWVAKGLADATDEMPEDHRRVYAMLDDGAGEPCLFLPFLGEFGHKIMSHIRLVHWHKASRKIVCCRPGEEVLYPSAAECFTDWENPVPDRIRCASCSEAWFDFSEIEKRYRGHRPIYPRLTRTQELVAINPGERIPFRPKLRGLRADVVLGIRRREFCPEKNWAHWEYLAGYFAGRGYSVGVVGTHDTSERPLCASVHSGDFDTDAAIELIQNCRLFLSSDTGGAHLAATVGCPMVVFRETSKSNRDMRPRMREVNPDIECLPDEAWGDPGMVIRATLARLAGEAARE